MPLRKTTFTANALAYLKPAMPEDGTPSLQLDHRDSPVCKPYAEGLLVCYVVDEGTSYTYVQYRHLEVDGIDEAELHRIGLHNLVGLVRNRDTRVQPYGNVFAVLMGGDFEASLLLLDQLWDEQFRQFVRGDYAVAIPARDILSFCDSNSAEGIQELQKIISRIQPSCDHLISNQIFVRRNSKWQHLTS